MSTPDIEPPGHSDNGPIERPVSVLIVRRQPRSPDAEDVRQRLADFAGREHLDLEVRTVDGGAGAPRVLDAIRAAQHDVVVVMDAGRGHPPAAIIDLLAGIDAGHDLVIGSRYVAGGKEAGGRAVLRRIGRAFAHLLARPLSPLKDPTSGFFAVRRATLDAGETLDPTCHAVALELLVKGCVTNVAEVPIQVGRPTVGRAPLTAVRHVRQLYIHRFGVWSDFAHFIVVGASGTVVNLACLTAFVAAGITERVALGLAIAVSMFTNFLLNRRFTFAGARLEPFFRQLAGFTAACSLGALVNFAVADVARLHLFPDAPIQVAAVVGIVAGTALNFVVNRYLVFRVRRQDGTDATRS